MNVERYDAIVAGASVAGAASALLLARQGLKVLIADRKSDAAGYKALCTHFIQPIALPVIRKLGLEEAVHNVGGVPTKAAFCTLSGWIDPPGASYGEKGDSAEPIHAINIERSRLDPLLMAKLHETEGITVELGCNVDVPNWSGDEMIVSLEREDEKRQIATPLLVAADGRTSPVARALGNETVREFENQRACCFAYFDDVPSPPGDRSLFFLGDSEMAFLYPLSGGRALLSAYMPKGERPTGTPQEKASALIALFGRYPDVPDLSRARLASAVYGYSNYPGLKRRPATPGTAFVGDAVLSLDPMSGVGCSFALKMADQLADAIAANPWSIQDGLAAYSSDFEAFYTPHAEGIAGDSIIAKSRKAVAATYERIGRHPNLQRLFIDLTGRLIMPVEFQQAYLRAGIAEHRQSA